ncbi:MAG: mechanosensitive ion channel family protein [Coriobacteriales bacterium]|jgi:hypothetical protein
MGTGAGGALAWLDGSSIVMKVLVAVIWIVVVLAIVVVLDKLIRRFLGKRLSNKAVPASVVRILGNVIRVFLWVIGIAFILYSVFGINVTGFIAALGIGGLAISLACQDTLANFIAGMTISTQKVIDIGDRIEVGGRVAQVEDVNWRHTVARDALGNTITVPNSGLAGGTVVVLPEVMHSETPVLFRYGSIPEGESLDGVCARLEQPLRAEVEKITKVEKGPLFIFQGADEYGYRGVVVFKTAYVAPVEVTNAVVRELSRQGMHDAQTNELADPGVNG